ncbi:MAG: hypothetical protein ACNA7G_14370 [Methylobacter sp.]
MNSGSALFDRGREVLPPLPPNRACGFPAHGFPVENFLSGIENWVYANENTQKLQFEIDPGWYGELPRTYFFDSSHQCTGVSGTLSKADYDEMFGKILK